jgi:hypothetical protein
MTALSTPNAPVIEVGESGALDVTWTKVTDADQYVLKAYKGMSYGTHDSAFDLTVGNVDKAVMPVAPGTSYKVTVTAQDTTATKTDSLESPKSSSAATSTIPGEAQETEAPAEVESINPFTGEAFAFAASVQSHSYMTYGRADDGTVYQALSDDYGYLYNQGPRAGSQNTKQRDAGDVTAALSLASDLRYVLTDPSDSTNGVAVVDPVALTVSTPTNTYEDYFVVGEGTYTQFTDRVLDEVDPDTTGVVFGAGKKF